MRNYVQTNYDPQRFNLEVIKNEARFGEVVGAKVNLRADDDDFDAGQE